MRLLLFLMLLILICGCVSTPTRVTTTTLSDEVKRPQAVEITPESVEDALIAAALPESKRDLSVTDLAVLKVIRRSCVSCRDSDDLDFNQKGEVKIILRDWRSQKPLSLMDRCSAKGEVVEFICQKNLPYAKIIRCDYGCWDGACIKKSSIPTTTTTIMGVDELCPPASNDVDGVCKPRPTCSNVVYGPYNDDSPDYDGQGDYNVLDIWLADSDKPTPLVVYIHGGGFYYGSKEFIFDRCYPREDTSLIKMFLDAGVSVASINYRLTENHPEWAYTRKWYDNNPTPASMFDAARAVWFLRSHAKDYNIDPDRVATTGTSAGGGISFWLAFHDDIQISPENPQSTRPNCIGPWRGQSTYDLRVIHDDVLPGAKPERYMSFFYNINRLHFDFSKADYYDVLFKEASPVYHLSGGDPPVFMYYSQTLYDDGGRIGGMHNPSFGLYVEGFLKDLGIPYELHYRNNSESEFMSEYEAAVDMKDFFFKHCFS